MVLVGSLGNADAPFKSLSEKPKVLISCHKRVSTRVSVDEDSHNQICNIYIYYTYHISVPNQDVKLQPCIHLKKQRSAVIFTTITALPLNLCLRMWVK